MSHAKTEELPRLHHDEPPAVPRALHRCDGQSHQAGLPAQEQTSSGFTIRYNLTRLAYYERFVYPDAAIAREKEIKGWRRSKKVRLIESLNPHWNDLAEGWWDQYKPTQVDVEPTFRANADFVPRA